MSNSNSKLCTYSLLYGELENELLQLESERRMDEGYSSLIILVRNYIDRLKEATGQPFHDQREEITFFRDIWPKFYAKLFFYQLINAFEIDCEFKSPKEKHKEIEEAEEEIAGFFEKNKPFWSYYRGGSDLLDYQFTREYSRSCLLDPLSELLDREWGTIAGHNAAWALAYHEYSNRLAQIKDTLESENDAKWKWVAPKTHLAEFIVCMNEMGAITLNGRSSTSAQLIRFFEVHWDINLKDFHKLLYETDMRKTDDTPFLTRCRQVLQDRRKRLDK